MRDALYYVDGPVPETPEPKQKQDKWKKTSVVGEALPRVDAYDRLSGTAVYPSDVTLPGMLHGAMLRCPHAHARVTSIDTSKAEKMQGVRAVITDKTPGTDIPFYRDQEGNTVGRLFDPHCRFEGEVVAAVAAAPDDAQTTSLRVETIRAFYASESGASVVLSALSRGSTLPAAGDRLDLGVAALTYEELPAGGSGNIEIQGTSGFARRRILLEIE